MEVPTEPEVCERLPIEGWASKVNVRPLLATLATVTTIGPVVAPDGTGTVMLVELHPVFVVAAVPLKVTLLVP
jgi:hypothetical protein